MHAIKEGVIVKTWVLYPEEMTTTNHQSVLVHPVLRTGSIEPGDYRLRFEMELPSGDLLLAENDFSIQAR